MGLTRDAMVCRWQTVEDGPPRDRVESLLRHEAHVTEHLLIAVPVRHPATHAVMRVHLMLRASQVTGDLTAALEPFDGDDGA